MPLLADFLALTLAGQEPVAKEARTPSGARVRWLAEGVVEVMPVAAEDAGLDLVLSAGVHGCEVVPIRLLDQLIQRLERGDIRPRARLLLLLCNPPAMRRGVRRVGQDLNRLFCGAHAGQTGWEADRAALLERAAAEFYRTPGRARWHYDLHSAMRPSRLPQFAVCPWVPDRSVSPQSLWRLGEAAVDAVLVQERPSATFSAHTATRHGAEAFTLEVAEAPDGTWPACLDRLLDAAQGWIEATAVPAGLAGIRPQAYRLAREIVKRSERFVLHVPDDIENFTPLPPGMLLAEDGPHCWVAEGPHDHILFPLADVAVGERAALIVEPRPW
ncbi:succinylglutamate desuccinylase [Pseudomonas sp. PS1]|uniref:Succinylglutamate desuccinylase n=1 Tax=Stutzerimonas marianensis TaxID=2929513 RepID=A0A9X1W6H7_9GAMM|nr:succinylglutamate desuccinylase [Pseudomonas marianensis]